MYNRTRTYIIKYVTSFLGSESKYKQHSTLENWTEVIKQQEWILHINLKLEKGNVPM